ncbi:hypothetical protein CesoFtcFv8_001259 [Champsocephalus esox]|uniref:Uncharacterized protein n=1 Tax=Champsocephalus esox TaxID=159716 RepID=A0AAN8D7W8_9TELE|nr:hypothetical protein CesoFtcFv8_001259 [Champsocephalus esox]
MSGRAPVAAKDAGTGPHAIPSWGSRLDLTMVSPAEDVLELNYMEDEEDASEFLLSDSDEQEDDVFMSPAQATKPGAMAALSGDSTPASPLSQHGPTSRVSTCCGQTRHPMARSGQGDLQVPL